HTRDLLERHVLEREVVAEIFEALDILFHFFPLRIGHKNNSVDTPQHQLPGRVVNYLAGDGIKLKLGHESLDHDRIQRKKIEKECAFGRSRERNQIAAVQRIDPLVNVVEVRGLAAQRRPVVDNLELNLAARVINDRHAASPSA